MTMQEALHKSYEAGLFARPTHVKNYVYRYVDQNRKQLISVFGRDRYGILQGGFWRSMNREEIEASWIICDENGSQVDLSKPRGFSISKLIEEAFA